MYRLSKSISPPYAMLFYLVIKALKSLTLTCIKFPLESPDQTITVDRRKRIIWPTGSNIDCHDATHQFATSIKYQINNI